MNPAGSADLFALILNAVLKLDDNDFLHGVMIFVDAEGSGDRLEVLRFAQGLLQGNAVQ